MKRDNRYRQLERMMTYALLIDLLFFVLYFKSAFFTKLVVILQNLFPELQNPRFFYQKCQIYQN